MPHLTPNSIGSVIESAVSKRSLLLGRAAHAFIIRTLDTPPPAFLSNHLVNLYSKLDLPGSAELVIRLTPSRSVVTWTTLIAGLVQNGHFASALIHFSNMLRDHVQPNDFTIPCAFKAAASLRLHATGKQVHAFSVKSGQVTDVFVGCSAFAMYLKTGLIEEAKKLFDEMPEKSIAMWNAYISNAVDVGRPRDAVHKFIEFRRAGGNPDSITFCKFLNACSDASYVELGQQLHGFSIRSGFEESVQVSNGFIDFYGKCGKTGQAEVVFDEMRERNDVSWCTLVSVFVQNHEDEKACGVFLRARKEGVEPKDFMVSIVISACAGLSGLELGRSVHSLAVKACVDDNIYVGSALVDMYGKCGSIEDAERAFHEMPERNLVTWNAMMGGYSHQGHSDTALALFEEMTGSYRVPPSHVTLVCVLSACTRAGAVKQGMEIFESMRERYGIEASAEHYACIVDLLGRAGMVERAYEFIKKMPISPTISVWGALLNACKVYGKPELGTIAAHKLFELDPKDSGNHVLLSNLLAASGRLLMQVGRSDPSEKGDEGCWDQEGHRLQLGHREG
ncbi:pentatricopeptide repeat-containing protein At4g14850 isoform X2 [Tripterygium wilfordii]|uniref:pentatricopeptide repeat-containing protein At4g14850 isoform X2 n=1 Tax=Tripterygium wilfordii TaxID=458696 RepID=UPI0018F83CA7|nr:pentatricopeptide repeat-containing protein At4g14850 isoform X2 [Tripterygium wilfordii]